MSVIDRLQDIIATAAASLFQEFTLRRMSGRTSDGRGGFTPTWQTYVAKGQVTDFSDELRYLRSIPEDARLLILQGKDIPNPPLPEDYVAIAGASWKIISVETVPGNAIYECEVHPDTNDWGGADLSTYETPTPDLLSSLRGVVANAGSVIFKDLTYYYRSNHASDGRGGNVRVLGAVTVKGIITEYSDRLRATMGIDAAERMVIIQGDALNIAPSPGDIVQEGSDYFLLTNIKTVPGQSVYEARGRRTTADAAALPAITADASGTFTFTGASTGQFVGITADAAGTIDDFTSTADGEFTIAATAVGTIADFTGAADATLPLEGNATIQLLSAFTVESLAQPDLEADGTITIDAFTGASDGDQRISGDAAGVIADFTGAGSGGQENTGDATINFSFTSGADGTLPISGDQAPQTFTFTSASDATNPIEADSVITLAPFTSGGSSTLPIEGSHVAVVADFVGASSGGQGDLTATAAATLFEFTSTCDATLDIEADATINIDAFSSTATGTNDIEADASGTMDDFTSSASGTLPIDGDASATVADFTGSSDGTVGSGSSNEAETDALIARMTTAPTTARETAINTLIKGLKDNGLWAKMDLLYVMAAHDEQAALLNWKGSSFNATNSRMTFTTDWGFGENTGLSPNSAPGMTTGWNSQNDAVQFTDNSMHIGVWGKAQANREYFKMGTIEMQCGGTVTTGDNFLNFGGNTDYSDANTNSLNDHKLMSANYNNGGDDKGRFYHAGVEAAASPPTITSGFIENAEMQMVTRGNNGGNAGLRIFHVGAELSSAEASTLYGLFDDYITAL